MVKFSRKFWIKIIRQGLIDKVLEILDKALYRNPVYRRTDWRLANKEMLVTYVARQMLSFKAHLLVKSVKLPRAYDEKVLFWQKWIRKNVGYMTDWGKFKSQEVWEDINDVLTTMLGDCESQATLLYVLCRKSGIPRNRLRLWGGIVEPDVGHVWSEYRSTFDGNWRICDTTYYPDLKIVSERIVADKKWRYKVRWWGFDESYHYKGR